MDFFHYFLKGMEFIMQDSILFYFQVFLLSSAILWLVRRLTILRTGGSFSAPYHIVEDTLYIHAGLSCIGKRAIPFSEMRAVHVDPIHSPHGGRYYAIQILRKSGLHKFFTITNNAQGKVYLEELKEALRKHGVGVRYLSKEY